MSIVDFAYQHARLFRSDSMDNSADAPRQDVRPIAVPHWGGLETDSCTHPARAIAPTSGADRQGQISCVVFLFRLRFAQIRHAGNFKATFVTASCRVEVQAQDAAVVYAKEYSRLPELGECQQ